MGGNDYAKYEYELYAKPAEKVLWEFYKMDTK